jgi:hypothetical protein
LNTKRRLGAGVNVRPDRCQRRAMLLKAIVHKILVLLLQGFFCRALLTLFLSAGVVSRGWACHRRAWPVPLGQL